MATASLELGLDIGDVDLVCQLGSPRSIATFLQRAGRSGHAVGGVPKARLFPQSRDELVECAALLDCVRRGELDAITVLPAPLDVLAQHLVAEIASREWGEDELFALVRRAWPYAQLKREDFNAVVRMLSDGFTTRHGQRASYVHRDAVHHRLRERKGARLTALTSGGAIPDTADYTVLLEPQADKVGTVHEDFAVESIAGDVFQLGNTSYRILRIEPGRVRVEDARGAAPNIPFWLGEAPGRSDELSFGVARLRQQWPTSSRTKLDATVSWLEGTLGLEPDAARQLTDYRRAPCASLGAVPTQALTSWSASSRVGWHAAGDALALWQPAHRAWGLALRTFCRQFNFELQAAATEDASCCRFHEPQLSAGRSRALPAHRTARDVLVRPCSTRPCFGVRWRWNATPRSRCRALPAAARWRRTAAHALRSLLVVRLPDQVACAETWWVNARCPSIRWSRRRSTTASTTHGLPKAGLQPLATHGVGRSAVLARDLHAPSPLAAGS